MNNKVYLVINDYANDSCGNMVSYRIFSTYEKAKEYFEEEKNRIKSYELGYDGIEDTEDLYCESIEGEWLYYHEQVMIVEKEVE